MSVLTPNRVVAVVAALLLSLPALAANPSPRTAARMAFDESSGVAVMFGGRGFFDTATQVSHDSEETWLWNGGRWLQRFPLTTPPARSAHAMVYDAFRDRIVMFGGRQEPDEPMGNPILLGDTWVWNGSDWSEASAEGGPAARQYPGMAFDRSSNRVVLFGGTRFQADGTTAESIIDMWEFDGVGWTEVSANHPAVAKPLLEYDRVREELILVGIDNADSSRVMYRFDRETATWTEIVPATMPTCVNEAAIAWNSESSRIMLVGGICTTGMPPNEEIFEWDGTNWTKITLSTFSRTLGPAVTWDPVRGEALMFGGSAVGVGVIGAGTYLIEGGVRRFGLTPHSPSPRSLAAFGGDPARGAVWMFGGLDQSSAGFLGDLWGHRDGQWYRVAGTDVPGGCEYPLAAYDTDRSVLVVTCIGSGVFEWDGTEWKRFENLSKTPVTRKYAALVYDANLKKTVLFGGYNENYRNDTWLWNGSQWTEIKGDRPEHRGLMAMWYDPLKQRTILYGGLGRANIYQKITRYSDMWAFDGTDWTRLNVAQTPGERFGPQIAIEPSTGKLLLLGGLRSESTGDTTIRQFYDNDMWVWDGSASSWTRLQPARLPSIRENGMMAWDPVAGRIVLFGGYAEGFFRSDAWSWDGTTWHPYEEFAVKRRSGR